MPSNTTTTTNTASTTIKKRKNASSPAAGIDAPSTKRARHHHSKASSRASRHLTQHSFASHPPLSFNLIDNVSIVSTHPLPFTCHLSSLAESFGLNAFSRGNTILLEKEKKGGSSSDDGDDAGHHSTVGGASPNLDLEAKCASFYASLCHYKHPDQPLPALIRSQLNQVAGDTSKIQQQDLKEYLENRVSRWTQAFTSLYSMLRNGKCPYFYVRTNTGKNSVIFLSYGVGANDVRAILNHSSSKMRSELQKYSVEFVEFAPEDNGEGASKTSPYSAASAHTLLFQGKRNVHALFNFLLVEACSGVLKWMREDVPELLASTPFIYGTLDNVEVKQLREHTSGGSLHHNRGAAEKKYVLHISGICMPHTIYHMCRVFKQSLLSDINSESEEECKLTLNFRIVEETSHFNCIINAPSLYQAQYPFSKLVAHEASEQEFGYLDRQQDEALHDKVIKTLVMRCGGSDGVLYDATLSDRPT